MGGAFRSDGFFIFKDEAGEFRWRLRGKNGKIIAVSGEGYVTKEGCEHGISLVKAVAPTAEVYFIDEDKD
jgi:uncharacterized protein